METMIFYLAVTMFLAMCSAYCARAWPQLAFVRASAGTSLITVDATDEDDGCGTYTRPNVGNYGCKEDPSRSIRCPPGQELMTMRCGTDPQHVEPIHAPSWPPYLGLPPIRMTKFSPNNVDKEGQEREEDGIALKYSEAKVRDDVYHDCLKSFEDCGDRETALTFMVVQLGRYPGYQSAVRQAFREIYPKPKNGCESAS